jgi:hypothetical protein
MQNGRQENDEQIEEKADKSNQSVKETKYI